MNSNRKHIIFDGYSVLVILDRAFSNYKLYKKNETSWELQCPITADTSEIYEFLSREIKSKNEKKGNRRNADNVGTKTKEKFTRATQENKKTIKMFVNGWKVRIERKDLYSSISAVLTDYDSIRVRCNKETEDKEIMEYIIARFCDNSKVVVTSGIKRKSPEEASQGSRRTRFYETDKTHPHIQTIDKNYMDHYNRHSDITETPSERLLNTDHGIRLQRHSPIYSSTTGQSHNITTKKKGKSRKKYDPKILNLKTAMVEKRNEELWREQE